MQTVRRLSSASAAWGYFDFYDRFRNFPRVSSFPSSAVASIPQIKALQSTSLATQTVGTGLLSNTNRQKINSIGFPGRISVHTKD